MDDIFLLSDLFKSLDGLKFSEVEGILLGLYIVSILFLFVVVVAKENKRFGQFLRSMGTNDRGPSVKKTDYGYKISKLGDKYFSQVFWKNNLEQVSASLNTRFVGFELSLDREPEILLFEDKLPKSVQRSGIKEKCKPFEVVLGISDRGKVIKHSFVDLPSMYIDGRPGSGKSVALKNVIHGILESLAGSAIKCLILTTKTHDFREFKVGVQIIDPFDDGSTRLIDAFFDEIESDIRKLKGYLLSYPGFEFSNLELSRRFLGNDIPRRLIIMDEARDYLYKEKADSKDVVQKKQHLNNLTYTHLRRNSRFMTIPLIVASQVQSEGELGIPIKSFHSRLASFTNEAMSRVICGDQRLSSTNADPGKFYCSNIDAFLRVPFSKF